MSRVRTSQTLESHGGFRYERRSPPPEGGSLGPKLILLWLGPPGRCKTTQNLSNRSHLWVVRGHELSDIHANSLVLDWYVFFGSGYIYIFSVWMSRVWHQRKLYITLCTIIHGKSFKITLHLLLFLEPGKLMTLVWRDGNGGWGKPHKSTDKTS